MSSSSLGVPLDDLDLVSLAHLAKELDGLARARRPRGETASPSLMIPSISFSIFAEIFVGEVAVGAIEVVVEAVFDGGPDGDLGAGEKPLHRVGHDVRGRVANDVEPRWIGLADDLERRVGCDRRHQVDGPIADPDRDDVLGELSLRARRSRGVREDRSIIN